MYRAFRYFATGFIFRRHVYAADFLLWCRRLIVLMLRAMLYATPLMFTRTFIIFADILFAPLHQDRISVHQLRLIHRLPRQPYADMPLRAAHDAAALRRCRYAIRSLRRYHLPSYLFSIIWHWMLLIDVAATTTAAVIILCLLLLFASQPVDADYFHAIYACHAAVMFCYHVITLLPSPFFATDAAWYFFWCRLRPATNGNAMSAINGVAFFAALRRLHNMPLLPYASMLCCYAMNNWTSTGWPRQRQFDAVTC